MDKKLQDKLYKKYPKIFGQHKLPMTQTAMCWGLECGNGWYKLIDMLCSQLQWDIEHNKYPQMEATQVKEKFGTLRFYNSGVYEENRKITFREKIYYFLRDLMIKVNKELYNKERQYGVQEGMISFAEFLSGDICERCGSIDGVTQTKGWVVTLCKKCKGEYKLEHPRNR